MNSKSILLVIGVLLIVGVFASSVALADGEDKGGDTTEPAKKPQLACPIMGRAINKDLYVDSNGWRVYACCKGCVARMKDDPAKYVKELQDAGVQLEQTPQTRCPVMGGKINEKFFTEYDGRKIYFCCPGCPAKFEKDPAKYLKNIGITVTEKAEATDEEAEEAEGHKADDEHGEHHGGDHDD